MKGTKKHILHPGFKYTDAASTDIRKTFRKAYRELEAAGAVQRENERIVAEVDEVIQVKKVVPFRRKV